MHHTVSVIFTQNERIGLEGNTMDHDDRQVGRILSRREVLTLFGAAGTAVLATCIPAQPTTQQGASVAAQALIQTASTANRAALPGCIVRLAETEGSYFVDGTHSL